MLESMADRAKSREQRGGRSLMGFLLGVAALLRCSGSHGRGVSLLGQAAAQRRSKKAAEHKALLSGLRRLIERGSTKVRADARAVVLRGK